MTEHSLAVDIVAAEFAWPRTAPILSIPRFSVQRGERVFVRGPSGSGKSTLLGLIGGVLSPSQGSVHVLGTDIAALRGGARDHFRGMHIGFIFQMFNLIPYLNLVENVLLPAQFAKARFGQLERRALRQQAEDLLQALGLPAALWQRSVTALSIGQQQRVAAARALFGKPQLLIADEPTSALDSDYRDDFLKVLLEQCRISQASLLFVSHDLTLGRLFDRSVAMQEINQAPVTHAHH
jgi:putative ABC transport system ATP-binding protein